MAEQNPPSGMGRGGRGARLLAALQKVHRRPGEQGEDDHEEQPPKETAAAAPTPSMGRGAYLAQIIRKLPSSQPAPSTTPPEPSIQPSAPSLGRGAALSQLLTRSRPTLAVSAAEKGAVPKVQSPPYATPTPQPAPSVPMGRGILPASSSVPSVATSPEQPPRSQREASLAERMAQMTIKGAPTGQFKGSAGKGVDLHVNYIRLLVLEGMGVFEYHVSFDPIVDSKNMRFKMLRQPSCKEVIGVANTFDGAKLYLPMQLPQEFTDIAAILPTDNSPVKVTIKYIRKCEPKDCIHFYNVLLKRVMNALKLVFIRQRGYDPTQSISVPQHKLEIWPGYVTAIHEYDGGLMLNCDASYRVLRTNTAYDMLADMHSSHDMTAEAVAKLVGCVVMTRYNNRVYRIDDIDWSKSPKSTFSFHTGEEMTFMQYYKRNYDIDIQDPDQPLLIHRAKRQRKPGGGEDFQLLCLVPELCFLTGLTDDMRSDFRVMKDLAAHTRISPAERENAMVKFVRSINSNPETVKLLSEWGVSLESGSVAVTGRVLRTETIFYKNSSFPVRQEADWGQELLRNGVISAVDLTSWLIIFVKRDSSKVRDFINTLKMVGPQLGIRVNDPGMVELRDDRVENYLRACRDNISPSLQLIVVIFPTLREDRYNALKKLCCADMPVPSQVINARTISQKQKLRSVTQKIALQVNCKLGGELWALEIPMKNLMVCGIDVYHDPSRKGRSVLGFVGSLNNHLTKWYSQTAFQEPGQELGDCLKVALAETLRKYYEVNHYLPQKIFIFRDGVSDGQLAYVSEYEVEQMTSSFRSFGDDYQPAFSVIIVQKKINTKIFQCAGNSYVNPGPGTTLDHTVTRKNMYDFFLVSQHVRQGTVSPTHYIVIRDTSKLSPDHMQRLAYKLTHLYYNWSGTIRVPAPCQYAHKLAYLVGQNIRKMPSEALLDKLFFL